MAGGRSRLRGLNQGTMRAAVLGVVLAMAPAGAWGQVAYPNRDWSVNNETVWRQSIEADIHGGASPLAICRNADSMARTSKNAEFKAWAYGIARKYCAEAEAGPDVASPARAAAAPSSPTPSGGEQPPVINGIMVRLCSHGMPCLGQIRRAMGAWE